MSSTREIKFRVWDEQIEEFHYFGLVNDNKNLVEDGCFGQRYIEQNAEQYTGLKDKNGKEIYEGDIVNCCECGYEDEKEEYKIVYLAHQDYPAFDLWPQPDVESNGLSHYLACGEMEIIGNIHEEKDNG